MGRIAQAFLKIHDRLIALQAKPYIATHLNKSGWNQVTGEIAVFVSEPLPLVLGVDRGAEWEINDPSITSLMKAAKDANLQLVQHLLKAGADPNRRDQRGYTAVVHALQNSKCDSDTVEALLAGGALPNSVDTAGRTPLFWAASCPEIVSELLAAGADVNWKAPSGDTPLLNVVASGNSTQSAIATVKVLVRAGAQTAPALELARRTGQGQIAEFLENYPAAQ